jgi:hypothetical protein
VVIGRAHTNSDPDVYFYDKGSTTPKYVVDFHPNDVLWDGTLLVNRDGNRACAVSYDDTTKKCSCCTRSDRRTRRTHRSPT